MFACLALLKHTHLNGTPPPSSPPPPPRLTFFFFFVWRRLACLFSLQRHAGRQAGRHSQNWTYEHRHTACQPPTATVAHKHAHAHTHSHTRCTRIGLVPVTAICVCLYVGLLYQGMCYINVWMWMNGCWNESFDIWKVQKVRLLHAVRANISLKKV